MPANEVPEYRSLLEVDFAVVPGHFALYLQLVYTGSVVLSHSREELDNLAKWERLLKLRQIAGNLDDGISENIILDSMASLFSDTSITPAIASAVWNYAGHDTPGRMLVDYLVLTQPADDLLSIVKHVYAEYKDDEIWSGVLIGLANRRGRQGEDVTEWHGNGEDYHVGVSVREL